MLALVVSSLPRVSLGFPEPLPKQRALSAAPRRHPKVWPGFQEGTSFAPCGGPRGAVSTPLAMQLIAIALALAAQSTAPPWSREIENTLAGYVDAARAQRNVRDLVACGPRM